MQRFFYLILVALLVSSCGDDNEEAAEIPIRGLRTVLVKEFEPTIFRRYPSVLQAAEISTLSFEISGRLAEMDLKVGQRVAKGDVIAQIDQSSLEIQLESAEAALRQAESTAKNAAEDRKRKEALLKKGVTTNAQVDQARMTAETSEEQANQARKQVETAERNLEKAVLTAPFSGIINSVSVDSFANVPAGAVVATIYAADRFESAFSVSYDIVNRLTIGKQATVRLADNPAVALLGKVSELGSRADTVSSFPVVVALDETDPSMKAGMAVEITFEFAVPSGQGFALPLSVLSFDGQIERSDKGTGTGQVSVFVYDPADSTVRKRIIVIGGVRDNALIAIDGLKAGERVASAGVSYLREGQKVRLLPDRSGD